MCCEAGRIVSAHKRLSGYFAAIAALATGCADDGGSAETTSSTGTPATSTAPADADGTIGSESSESPTTSSGPTTSASASATDTAGSTSEDTTNDTTTGALQGCDDPNLLVCEDFEDAALGGNPDGWDLRGSGVWGGNTMGVTNEQAVSGSQAFRVASGENGAQWLTYMGDISPFADGHWGRMYFRMGSPVPWPDRGVIHGDLFEARGNWNGSTHQVRWAVINNSAMQHNWGYNVQTSDAGEFIYETGYVYSWTEDWLCVEWHHDQAAQQATLWVDGEQLVDVPAGDDPQLPTFDDISVGWANYQIASPEFIVYIDDVVLDDERVGCGR